MIAFADFICYNVAMEFVELKKHLKAQKLNACYACFGEDDFVLDRAVTLLCSLAGEPKPFNLVDKEFASSKDLIDELMQLPIMSDHRVVVARGKIDNSAVEEYLKQPNPSTVLVLTYFIVHDSWNRSPALALPIGATPVDCNRLPLNQIIAFVKALAQRTQTDIDDKTIQLLSDRCGGYMTRINAETQKLTMLRAGGIVTASDVIDNVKPDTEFVVFELCECLLAGNSKRALEVVDGMAKNNDLVAAFTLIYNRFRKLFAAAVDPDGLSGLGVKPFQVQKLKSESAKFSKARLKILLDMLAQADIAYKTGAMTVYDALACFVAQAAYEIK